MVPLAAWGGWLSVPLLAVIAFLAGTAALVFGISALAYIRSLVRHEDLAAANRAVQATATVDEVVGPGLAGALVAAVGPAMALFVDAVSYLASAVGVAKGRPLSRRVAGRHPVTAGWSALRLRGPARQGDRRRSGRPSSVEMVSERSWARGSAVAPMTSAFPSSVRPQVAIAKRTPRSSSAQAV